MGGEGGPVRQRRLRARQPGAARYEPLDVDDGAAEAGGRLLDPRGAGPDWIGRQVCGEVCRLFVHQLNFAEGLEIYRR